MDILYLSARHLSIVIAIAVRPVPHSTIRTKRESASAANVQNIMHLTPIDTALNMQLTSMEADLNTYGFPPGYFVLKNVATDRVLDVQSDMVEDGTPVILYDETETSLVEGTQDSFTSQILH